MAGVFDDLIPTSQPSGAQGSPPPAGAFDDLIPAKSPSDAQSGPNGLLWNANGGYDPKSGDLVVAGKPFSENAPSQPLAAASGVVNGVPVAGSSLENAAVNVGAWLRNKLYGDPQDQTASAVKGDIAQSQAAYPKTTTAANVGGAVAGTAPLAETALGARALGLVGSMPARIVQGMAGGAAIGGADAAARGESPEGGAATGLGLGVIGPAAGAIAGKAVTPIWNAIAPSVDGSFANLSPIARNILTKAVQDETPATIAAGAQRVGPSGFLGDLTPSLTDITGGIADMPGAGKGIVREAYLARDANPALVPGTDLNGGPRGRLDAAITDAFGPPVNIAAQNAQTIASRASAADPLYQAWRNTPVGMTPELQRILQLPSVQKALPDAERMAGDESQPFADQNGNPTAMTWDYVKRAVDDSARSAGPGTNSARIAGNISSQITNAIDNHPDPNVAGVWQQARQAWANPTAILNATESGQNVFGKAQRADELAQDFGALSQPEQGAFLQGARDNVRSLMDASVRGDTTARNTLLAPENQAKLQVMIGPQKANTLIDTLQQEGQLKVQNQNVVGGSQTTPKATRTALVSPPNEGGIAGYIKNAMIDKPGSLIPWLEKSLSDYQGSKYENARAQIAPIVTTSGSDRDALVQALVGNAQRTGAQSRLANNVDALTTVLLGAGGGELARRAVAPHNIQLMQPQRQQ